MGKIWMRLLELKVRSNKRLWVFDFKNNVKIQMDLFKFELELENDAVRNSSGLLVSVCNNNSNSKQLNDLSKE